MVDTKAKHSLDSSRIFTRTLTTMDRNLSPPNLLYFLLGEGFTEKLDYRIIGLSGK